MQINITFDTHRDNPNVLAKLAGSLGANVAIPTPDPEWQPISGQEMLKKTLADDLKEQVRAAKAENDAQLKREGLAPEKTATEIVEEGEDLSVVRGKNAEKLRDELQQIIQSGDTYDVDWWERQHGRLPKKHQDAIREATLEPRTEAIAEQTKEADAAPPESVPEEGDTPLTLGDLKSYGESMVYDHDDQAMQIAISSRLRTVLNEGFGVKKFADVAEEDIPACYAKLKEIRAEFYEDAE